MNEEQKQQPLLSINDVIACCYDNSANGGILYLHIEKLIELAKQKIEKK